MALTRLNEFDAGTPLAETEIEGEFDNIYANSLSLISPLTGNLSIGGFRLTGFGLGTVGDPSIQFTGDTNTGVYSTAADTFDITTGGVRAASFGASALIAAAPEDARTATVDVAAIIRSTTSGVPAASIGTGLQFDAESADENPSTLGRVDFIFTDVTAASEDSVMDILLRTAGAAEGARYRFQSTGAFLYTITGAPTAARTITIPDLGFTMGAQPTRSTQDVATSETTTSTTYTDLATSGPAVTITPGRATDQLILMRAHFGNNNAATASFMSVAVAGVTAVDANSIATILGNNDQAQSGHLMPLAVVDGCTHTAKYRVSGNTGTFVSRRISAFTLS